jgi:DNA-binding PadR family transcriptional regulator
MGRSDASTSLSLAILGLVALESLSGYDLRKIFSSTPLGHFSASPGAIYPALKRLEKKGFVAGTTEKKDTLRPRRVYSITRAGRRSLESTLMQPVTHSDIVWRLEELVLRFAFMGDIVGTAGAIEFLQSLESRINEYLPSLRRQRDAERERGTVTGAYALELGIEKYETTVRWARRVSRALKKRLKAEG